MTYRLLALSFMAVFYMIYFGKMLIQRRKGIVTNQIAKGKEHDRTFYVEAVMKVATLVVPLAEVISIVLGTSGLMIMWRVIGMYFAFIGDIIFFLSVYTMKDSWRAGVASSDMDQRKLVTRGIYNYSRNPAFLGFDLVYIGILLMFFNPVLMVLTIFAIVMLHLQILQEEKFLPKVFGEDYLKYKERTSRYAGLGKLSFDKIRLYIYFILFVWSVLYFFTCLAYGGGLSLSWVWIWIVIGAFSLVRVLMLGAGIKGLSRIKIAPVFSWVYRIVFGIFLISFIIIECKVIGAMTAAAPDNLEYVVLLGAGLHGTQPSNPYRARIQKAAEYLEDNENAILIASGGQGYDEAISEAECAKRVLVEQYGIDEDRIILEDKSRDTEENLKNSLAIIGDADASVGIITNGFHECRAMSIAESVGYENVHSVPAKTLFPVGIHYIVREFFGMVEFYLKYEL